MIASYLLSLDLSGVSSSGSSSGGAAAQNKMAAQEYGSD